MLIPPPHTNNPLLHATPADIPLPSPQSGTCQCTQCRRNTSSLFFAYVRVPVTALTWVPPADGTSTTTLRDYSATAGALRGYCARCGGMMYWRREGGDHVSLAVGTIDPLFLFGEGTAEEKAKVKVWGGEGMPDTGFGNVLISGEGAHEWCGNEIKGVTDEMPMLMRGKRVAKD